MSNTAFIGSIIAAAILIWVAVLAFWLRVKIQQRREGPRLLDSVFLEILMPKEAGKRSDQPETDDQEKEMIGVAEQLFATLSHIQKKERISFEMISADKKISFYINCPGSLQDLVEKQIHAQYPYAQIDEVPPPKVIKKGGYISAVEIGLKKGFFYPVKSYKLMESDPLSALTNSLSKLSSEETGVIQLVISPARSNWRTKINRKAMEIQKGGKIDTGDSAVGKIAEAAFQGLSDGLTSILNPRKKNPDGTPYRLREKDEPKPLTPMQQEAVKRLEEKASKSGFLANVRMIVASPDRAMADSHLRNILSSFMQYSQEPFNSFRVLKKPRIKVIRDFLYRRLVSKWGRKKLLLNTEELASIFHLPDGDIETPNIKWLGSKKAPAPVNLPETGPLLGINTYRGIRSEVRIDRSDRRRHMYIIGRTGTGKSEFMKSMARQDIEAGEGVGIIDPHGDFVEDLLRFVPKKRADDVILFEPFDTERPMGLNMLEAKNEEEKDFAVQEMIAIFYKLFPPEMIGPMFEHNMRNVMLTLMADERTPGTIAEIPRMFTDPDYQKYRLTYVKDPVVRSFWEQEMAKTSDFHKSEMLGYLISKVGRFVENEMMRNIIGQSRSAFDLREVMDKGKILLINLSKGKTGEVNSKLLGLILVSKLQMAALERADMPEESRRDFYLYIDEFQNFVTDSLATILSEARKYRLDLIMAHQYINQLVTSETDTKVRDAVFGNAGTIMSFRVGVEDAEVLGKEFEPVFSEHDVINIDRFNAYIKLMINGTASRPFNIETLPPPAGGSEEVALAIRQLSKLKYGRPKEEVAQEIMKRSRIGQLSTRSTQIS